MKPHSMCFDETYSQKFYQSDTVSEFLVKKCDGLIVVGTALQTSFAKRAINSLVARDNIPIVEVNLEVNIEHGYVMNLVARSEECLPELFTELISLQSA